MSDKGETTELLVESDLNSLPISINDFLYNITLTLF